MSTNSFADSRLTVFLFPPCRKSLSPAPFVSAPSKTPSTSKSCSPMSSDPAVSPSASRSPGGRVPITSRAAKHHRVPASCALQTDRLWAATPVPHPSATALVSSRPSTPYPSLSPPATPPSRGSRPAATQHKTTQVCSKYGRLYRARPTTQHSPRPRRPRRSSHHRRHPRQARCGRQE